MNVQAILDSKGGGDVFVMDQNDTLADFVKKACELEVGAMLIADDDIKTAMDCMITLKIRHLPVLSGKEIAGLITIRDLILAMRQADDRETRQFVEYLRRSLEARGVSATE